ncbi:ABC transporter permease [[Eubacterium] cellulosolvens]
MNLVDLIRWAFSALSERKLRSGLTVLMVVIGVTLITSINGLNAGTEYRINEQFASFGANLLIVSSGGQGFGPSRTTAEIPLNDQTVKTLSRIKHVDKVVPYVQGSATLKRGGDEKVVQVIGLDQSDFEYLAPSAELLEGRYVSPTDSLGMLLSYNVAFEDDEQVLEAGQTVFLEISKAEETGGVQEIEYEEKSFQIKGVLDEIGSMTFDNAAYISLPAANALFDKGNEYNGIYIVTDDSEYNEDIEEDIQDIYEETLSVTSPRAIAERISEMMGTFTSYISTIAFVSLIVGAVGIITTLYTSVIERTREIGLLKSLGFNNGMILSSFMIESMLIGAIGGLLGLTLGFAGAYVLGNVFAFGGPGRDGITPIFEYIDLLSIWLISFALSILSGIYPAWRASKLSPLEALRKE